MVIFRRTLNDIVINYLGAVVQAVIVVVFEVLVGGKMGDGPDRGRVLQLQEEPFLEVQRREIQFGKNCPDSEKTIVDIQPRFG
jgi:hypothetical protein